MINVEAINQNVSQFQLSKGSDQVRDARKQKDESAAEEMVDKNRFNPKNY